MPDYVYVAIINHQYIFVISCRTESRTDNVGAYRYLLMLKILQSLISRTLGPFNAAFREPSLDVEALWLYSDCPHTSTVPQHCVSLYSLPFTPWSSTAYFGNVLIRLNKII